MSRPNRSLLLIAVALLVVGVGGVFVLVIWRGSASSPKSMVHRASVGNVQAEPRLVVPLSGSQEALGDQGSLFTSKGMTDPSGNHELGSNEGPVLETSLEGEPPELIDVERYLVKGAIMDGETNQPCEGQLYYSRVQDCQNGMIVSVNPTSELLGSIPEGKYAVRARSGARVSALRTVVVGKGHDPQLVLPVSTAGAVSVVCRGNQLDWVCTVCVDGYYFGNLYGPDHLTLSVPTGSVTLLLHRNFEVVSKTVRVAPGETREVVFE